MIAFITLIAGFILLVWGADHFVAGASALAKKMGVPPLIIGLTVVAFGTSAPELTVSVTAGMNQANELAISNVLGSNLFNLLVVIGGCALFTKQTMDKDLLKRDWPYTLVAVTALSLMIAFDMELSRLDGVLLLAGFFFVVGTQIMAGMKNRELLHEENDEISDISNPMLIAFNIFAGLACIMFGGDFCVSGASDIASMFGLSETIIGLTVVSVGTSLPELATSVAATRRGENDMAIGNVVGSTLFNVLLILSISSIINPIPVGINAVIDSIFVIMMCVFVLYLSKTDKINRNSGIAMVASYVIYMTYVVMRDMQPALESTLV